MRPARASTGFFRWVPINPRPYQRLVTSRRVEEEIFSGLEYVSEIPEIGSQLIQKRGTALEKIDVTFSNLQAFIRQAKTFYYAAEGLHHRASPLNHYYSFLNLAKALICLHDANLVSGQIRHGLSHQLSQGDLTAQELVVQSGVFPLFYKEVTGHEIPINTRIRVTDLFRYVTDVALESSSAGFGFCRVFRAQYRIKKAQSIGFATIVVHRFKEFSTCTPALDHLLKTYEQVTDKNILVRDVFGLFAEEQSECALLETRKEFPVSSDNIPVGEITTHCREGIEPLYMSFPFQHDSTDFMLCLPLGDDMKMPFNELLGIYALTYFLSSLVRYYPAYLEGRLHSKDAWVIESFARSTPLTFLRHVSNLLIGEDRAYLVR